MVTVAVNPPKTPVTKGSNGIAAATVPNVCKMPGPPPPFVPTPLPNIGQTGKDPKDYSTTVKFDGNPVGIQGSSFGSSGDIASKGTGGGIVSSNCEGTTKFVGPGSLDVKVEGKRVQFLGDQTLNNCGAGGTPANSATTSGETQKRRNLPTHYLDCKVKSSAKKTWKCCHLLQFCAKIHAVNQQVDRGAATRDLAKRHKRNPSRGENNFRKRWNRSPDAWHPMHRKFYHPCAAEEAAERGYQIGTEFQPDHVHELQLGGHATNLKNLKWLDRSVNASLGSSLKKFDPTVTPGGIIATCCPAHETTFCAGKHHTEFLVKPQEEGARR